jgi:predicted DNA-binding transcriptional regulator AlpA
VQQINHAYQATNQSEEYLTGPEVSALTKIPLRSIETLRYRGGGPRFLKVRGLVRYKRSDVIAWLEGGGK